MKWSAAQLRALSAAEAQANSYGLHKCRAGWVTSIAGEIHSMGTVSSLVDRGYLQLYVSGTVCHITDAGVAALQRWRDETEVKRGRL
jgi:hypothetical protein